MGKKTYAVICRHEYGADTSVIKVGTYEEVLDVAGEFWQQYDGDYNPNNPPESIFTAGDGYESASVSVTLDKKKTKIMFVNYDGGPEIEFHEITPIKRKMKAKNRS